MEESEKQGAHAHMRCRTIIEVLGKPKEHVEKAIKDYIFIYKIRISIFMTSKIGIIGAMDDEISMYIEHIKDIKENKWKIFTFYEGQFNGHNVVLVKSGVGKSFATITS